MFPHIYLLLVNDPAVYSDPQTQCWGSECRKGTCWGVASPEVSVSPSALRVQRANFKQKHTNSHVSTGWHRGYQRRQEHPLWPPRSAGSVHGDGMATIRLAGAWVPLAWLPGAPAIILILPHRPPCPSWTSLSARPSCCQHPAPGAQRTGHICEGCAGPRIHVWSHPSTSAATLGDGPLQTWFR